MACCIRYDSSKAAKAPSTMELPSEPEHDAWGAVNCSSALECLEAICGRSACTLDVKLVGCFAEGAGGSGDAAARRCACQPFRSGSDCSRPEWPEQVVGCGLGLLVLGQAAVIVLSVRTLWSERQTGILSLPPRVCLVTNTLCSATWLVAAAVDSASRVAYNPALLLASKGIVLVLLFTVSILHALVMMVVFEGVIAASEGSSLNLSLWALAILLNVSLTAATATLMATASGTDSAALAGVLLLVFGALWVRTSLRAVRAARRVIMFAISDSVRSPEQKRLEARVQSMSTLVSSINRLLFVAVVTQACGVLWPNQQTRTKSAVEWIVWQLITTFAFGCCACVCFWQIAQYLAGIAGSNKGSKVTAVSSSVRAQHG